MRKIEIIKGSDFQRTIKKPISFWGLSLNKKFCQAKILPAEENSGLTFIVNEDRIPALFQYLKETEDYTTILKKGEIEIRTVEHLLSALWGMGIDNAIIKLNSKGEIPLRDASARFYTQLIKKVGIRKQRAKRSYLRFNEEITFRFSKDNSRYIIFKPSSQLKIKATCVFPNIIGRQKFSFVWSPSSYLKDLSWARSFMNSPISSGGGKVWKKVRKKIPILPFIPKFSPIIVYTKDNYITPLKAPNEPIRHKVLDFFGDTSLVGVRFLAEIIVFKPGHKFNREVVRKIRRLIK